MAIWHGSEIIDSGISSSGPVKYAKFNESEKKVKYPKNVEIMIISEVESNTPKNKWLFTNVFKPFHIF